MSNPKQNNLCQCGSGKINKNCCGMSNVIEISPQLYNDELDQLHDELLTYALGNYDELFVEQTRINFQTFLNKDVDATESYLTGLTLWTILNVPLLENDQTIFDAFYSQQKGKIKRTRTRKTFIEWANTLPSVYEVLAIDSEETYMATIVEISSNKEFQVPIIDEDDYLEGSIVIGSLVPFVGFHHFFFDAIEIFGDHKKEIVSLIKRFSDDEDQLRESFPDFLAEALLVDMDDESEHLLDDQVLELFTEHMTNKGFDDQIVNLGFDIWQTYILIEEPTFNKPATYAAALEYLVQTLVVENHSITQKKIAEEYGITAGTVSANYRKLLKFMDDIIDPNIIFEDLPFQLDNHNFPEETSISPNSPDAYLSLAEDANSELEYGEYLRKAVQVGEKDLGKAFFLEHKGNFWTMIETRPYMRAKAMYADFLYETGAEEEAFKQYEEMLRLNPNDNQGIRHILLTSYIESAHFKKAQDLINDFKDEGTASFVFNKILVDYLIHGLTDQTMNFIKEANKQNPFIKNYLLGNKEIPHEYLDHVGFGDETEAIVYAQENIHLWEACPELLKEL